MEGSSSAGGYVGERGAGVASTFESADNLTKDKSGASTSNDIINQAGVRDRNDPTLEVSGRTGGEKTNAGDYNVGPKPRAE